MKNIIFILLLCPVYLIGQECAPSGISTNPDAPINNDCANQLNTFDWRTSFLNTPWYSGTSTMISPFFETGNTAIMELHDCFDFPAMCKDFLHEEGWELIMDGVSQTQSQTALNNLGKSNIVYFVLYNKFSATLRVLGAHDDLINGNSMRITLSYEHDRASGLLNSAIQIAKPLDEFSLGEVFSASRITSNNKGYFFYADFPMAYDPCICFLENGTVSVAFEKVTTSTITINGRAWAINGTVEQMSGGLGIGKPYLYTASQDEQAGILNFNTLDQLIGHYDAQRQGSGLLENMYQAWTLLKPLEQPLGKADFDALALPNLKAVSKFVDVAFAMMRVENKFGKIGMTQSELAFNASLTEAIGVGGFAFRTPGLPNIACSDEYYPMYNEVLGRFAVLEKPKINAYSEWADVTQRGVWDGKTYYYQNNFQFDRSSFKYVFNPAADINEAETKIYGAVVVNVNHPTDLLTYTTGKNTFYVEGVGKTPTDATAITPFVPIECLEEVSASIEGTTYLETEKLSYKYYLRLLILYEFNQTDANGKPIQGFEVLTYPLETVDKAEGDIPQALTNQNGSSIQQVLSVPTTNYTTSQTIFAWDRIEINGDITTAPGVEVRFVAPEVSVIGGSLGQGVSTEIGFFPTSCAPLLPASATVVSNFCSPSGKYQANQSKYPRPDDQPIAESEKETLNGVAAFDCQPNPFTQQFQARFTLSEESEVQLSLYNLMGSRVKDVVVGEMLPAGEQRFEVGTEELPSGVYFLTLQTKSGRQTVKVLKQ